MPKPNLKDWIICLKEAGATVPIDPPELEESWLPGVLHIAPFATAIDRRRPGKYGEGGMLAAATHTVIEGELPRWGQIDDATWADILPPIPLDWKTEDGREPTRRDWCGWLKSIADEIGRLIWPIYKQGAWTDATVGRLLDADFTLLGELRHYIGFPIDSINPTTVQHRDLFNDEDNRSIAFGTGYDRYDPTLSTQVLNCLPTILTTGIVDKVGSLDLQLKLIFQRPRSWQVAFLQGRKNFTYQSAATANSPSLVSGHSLQGCVAGCTAFAAFAKSTGMNAASIKTLQHFTVDVGDRRVFAGIHFPSDNLSSWFTALNLIPRVFPPDISPEVKAFLWESIDSRSVVFAAIKEHVSANPGTSPYEKAVSALRGLAGG